MNLHSIMCWGGGVEEGDRTILKIKQGSRNSTTRETRSWTHDSRLGVRNSHEFLVISEALGCGYVLGQQSSWDFPGSNVWHNGSQPAIMPLATAF